MSTKTSNASILLRDALIALEDLSFACDGGMGTEAPDREVFNRTFLVLDKIRSELGVGVARDYQPPAHETLCAADLIDCLEYKEDMAHVQVIEGKGALFWETLYAIKRGSQKANDELSPCEKLGVKLGLRDPP